MINVLTPSEEVVSLKLLWDSRTCKFLKNKNKQTSQGAKRQVPSELGRRNRVASLAHILY
jgi:hypothetical protein